MEWFFIRHGNMAGDPHARCQPPVAGCLSPKGEQQASNLGRQLDHVLFDEVLVSSLGRAIQTAQSLKRADGVELQVRDWLMEWRPAEVAGEHTSAARFEELVVDSAHGMPEQAWQTSAGEGTLTMAARIIPGWIADMDRIGVRAGHGGYLLDRPEDARRIAVVAHGGSLGMLLAFILGVPVQPYPPILFEETGLAVVRLIRRGDVWYPSLVIPAPGGTT